MLALEFNFPAEIVKQSVHLVPIPVGRVSRNGGGLRAEQGVATSHSKLWREAATQCCAQNVPVRRSFLPE
jgi:hypothetical protein